MSFGIYNNQDAEITALQKSILTEVMCSILNLINVEKQVLEFAIIHDTDQEQGRAVLIAEFRNSNITQADLYVKKLRAIINLYKGIKTNNSFFGCLVEHTYCSIIMPDETGIIKTDEVNLLIHDPETMPEWMRKKCIKISCYFAQDNKYLTIVVPYDVTEKGPKALSINTKNGAEIKADFEEFDKFDIDLL